MTGLPARPRAKNVSSVKALAIGLQHSDALARLRTCHAHAVDKLASLK